MGPQKSWACLRQFSMQTRKAKQNKTCINCAAILRRREKPWRVCQLELHPRREGLTTLTHAGCTQLPSLPCIWLLTDGIKFNMFCPQSMFCRHPLLPMAFMTAQILCLEARLKRSILFLSQLSVKDHVVIQLLSC